MHNLIAETYTDIANRSVNMGFVQRWGSLPHQQILPQKSTSCPIVRSVKFVMCMGPLSVAHLEPQSTEVFSVRSSFRYLCKDLDSVCYMAEIFDIGLVIIPGHLTV